MINVYYIVGFMLMSYVVGFMNGWAFTTMSLKPPTSKTFRRKSVNQQCDEIEANIKEMYND